MRKYGPWNCRKLTHTIFKMFHSRSGRKDCTRVDTCQSGQFITCNLYLFFTFPKQALFLRVCSTSALKTLWEKEKLLVTSNFSFSHSLVFPFREPSATFIKSKIVVCKLLPFEIVKILSFE